MPAREASALATPAARAAHDPRLDLPTLEAVAAGVIECERCPRLRQWCELVAREKRRAFRDQEYWGRPVPGFGDPRARLLIVGLAPAAHGGNRTGRMFTGDSSGDWLFAALYRHGFANQPRSVSRDDGLKLRDCYITAAARCAPPANRPTPVELERCQPWLEAEIKLLQRVRVVLVLGAIAQERYLRAARWWKQLPARERPRFAHGAVNVLPDDRILLCSYHPSRQNTQTGRLTPEMWDGIFAKARELVLGKGVNAAMAPR